nr:tyrosine-type recombinase/integrase [Robinsoniella sp. KNHs210]
MGKSNADDRNFWTQEEFSKFIDALMNKHQSYMAFMILYWTGIRIGELLALTADDVDFEKCTIRISKSYQRLSVRFRNRRIVRILIWFWPLTGCMVMPKGPGHLYGTASYDPAGEHETEKDPQADVGSRCIDH